MKKVVISIPVITCTLPIPIFGIFVFLFPWEEGTVRHRTVRHRQSKEPSILWSHHEQTRELPGERDNAWIMAGERRRARPPRIPFGIPWEWESHSVHRIPDSQYDALQTMTIRRSLVRRGRLAVAGLSFSSLSSAHRRPA